MGKDSGQTQTIQKSDPWAGQQPYLKQLFGAAQNLYQNYTPQYYPGQQVAGFSPYQSAAQQGIANYSTGVGQQIAGTGTANVLDLMNAARSNPLLNFAGQNIAGYSSALENLLSGGNGASQISYTPQAQQIGFTPTNINVGSAPTVQGQAISNPNAALGQLQSGAATNPYLDAAVAGIANTATRNFQQNVLPTIESQALSAGQYGGSRQGIAEGVAAGNVGQYITDQASQIYQQAYENDRNRQLQAAGLGVQQQGQQNEVAQLQAQLQAQYGLKGADLALATQQLAGQLAGQQANLGQQNQELTAQLAQRNAELLQGGQQLTQQGQLQAGGQLADLLSGGYSTGADLARTGVTALPTYAQLPTQLYSNLSQVGGQQQAQNQALIDAAMQQWNWQQQLPYNQLGQFQNFIQGGYGGTTTNIGPGESAGQNILGAAGTGLATYSGLMGAGGAVGGMLGDALTFAAPWTAGLFALGSLLS